MDFPAELKRHVARVERGLDQFLPRADTRPARLHTAMRYSLEAGGKRLRPVLVLAAAELFTGDNRTKATNDSVQQSEIRNPQSAIPDALAAGKADALAAAVAVECIHTYSLIHDDLPCMDNDNLRRGRPTSHKQFDEATALLAGDALLTHAFALLAENYPAPLAAALVREIATAAGSRRLIGGQMEDLLAEKESDATPEELEFIHLNKTAAMIEASLVMGGLVGGAGETDLATLRQAGRHLGLAFQIIDDILDATADTETLGKTAGKDAKAGKMTFVRLHGIQASWSIATKHSVDARAFFTNLSGNTAFLESLVEMLSSRPS